MKKNFEIYNNTDDKMTLFDFIKSKYKFENDGDFHDYEIEILDNSLDKHNIFATEYRTTDLKMIKGILTVNIKYGLYDDCSGYCHKIELNKLLEIKL